jgi:hypothetical protein
MDRKQCAKLSEGMSSRVILDSFPRGAFDAKAQ